MIPTRRKLQPSLKDLEYKLIEAVEKNDLDKVCDILSTCEPNYLKSLLVSKNACGVTLFMKASELETPTIFKTLLQGLINLEDIECLIQAYTAQDDLGQTYRDHWSVSKQTPDDELITLLFNIENIYGRALHSLEIQAEFSRNMPSNRVKKKSNHTYLYAHLTDCFIQNINQPNAQGNPPLIQRILDFNIDKVHSLLSQPGIDLSVKNKKGMNALMIAAERGLVKYLHPLLIALKKMPDQTIADIYNASEVVDRFGKPCSLKTFFYLQNNDYTNNYKKIESLLEEIESIAMNPDFKSAEERELDKSLDAARCVASSERIAQHHEAILAQLESLKDKNPDNPELFIIPAANQGSAVLFSPTNPCRPSKNVTFAAQMSVRTFDTKARIKDRVETIATQDCHKPRLT